MPYSGKHMVVAIDNTKKGSLKKAPKGAFLNFNK
jgi:hypothetical protein